MTESSFDYLKYMNEVDQLKNRDEKNSEVVTFIDRLQKEARDNSLHDANKKKLLKFFESEWDHQFLACAALREAGNKRRHDWSKDYYYIYVLAGKFGFQIKDAEYEKKWKEEVKRHYFLEPHHPQHKQKGGEITDLDIEEMAIDRLCRQAERHEGEIDMEGMKKFYPEFQGENAGKNLKRYIEYMQEWAESVKTLYSLYVKPKNPESLIPATD